MTDASAADPTDSTPIGLTLVWLLAALAGAVDARGIALLHDIFLSFMSGNSTMLAVSIAQGNWARADLIATVIGSFVAGAALGQMVAELARRWRLPVVLGLVSAILCVPLVYPAGTVPALSLAMGALNAAVQHAGKATVSLTFVTGALVRFGQGLGALLLGRTGGWLWTAQAVPWTGLVTGAILATLLMADHAALFHQILPLYALGLTIVTAVAVRRAG